MTNAVKHWKTSAHYDLEMCYRSRLGLDLFDTEGKILKDESAIARIHAQASEKTLDQDISTKLDATVASVFGGVRTSVATQASISLADGDAADIYCVLMLIRMGVGSTEVAEFMRMQNSLFSSGVIRRMRLNRLRFEHIVQHVLRPVVVADFRRFTRELSVVDGLTLVSSSLDTSVKQLRAYSLCIRK